VHRLRITFVMNLALQAVCLSGAPILGFMSTERMGRTVRRLRRRLLPGLRYLPQSRIRRCQCCERRTLIASFSDGDELKRCIRCGANLRYELLGRWIRHNWRGLERSVVLELDPNSPLRPLLAHAERHIRTYYSSSEGPPPADGAVPEDITDLSLPDASVDLIVSSEVLEHVPDLERAFAESARVLRPGGLHLFTVPPRAQTLCRAESGAHAEIIYHAPREYHSDPLDPRGILTWWDLGIEDGGARFSRPDLELSVVAGPAGRDGRVLWAARRRLRG
jgi:hypothetical protein